MMPVMVISDVGPLLAPGTGLMDAWFPVKQHGLLVLCCTVIQALPLLAGATVPNQGTKPGEHERRQILGQRGHFWAGPFSHMTNEATWGYIRREPPAHGG